MLDTLRPFISRLIAPFVTMGLTWLALHGFDFGADATGHVTEYAVVAIVGLMQIINGVGHKTIDKKFNPGDAASSHLAGAEKVEAEAIKAVEVK